MKNYLLDNYLTPSDLSTSVQNQVATTLLSLKEKLEELEVGKNGYSPSLGRIRPKSTRSDAQKALILQNDAEIRASMIIMLFFCLFDSLLLLFQLESLLSRV